MGLIVFANNANTTLASPISSSSTTLSVATGTGALFPSPTAGQYFALTLLDAATKLVREIVYVTNRSGDAMTVTRGQESTTALAWLAGDYAANDWTAGSAAAMIQVAQLQVQATNFAVAGGTANALTATLTPAPVSYASIKGSPIRIQLAGTNTGAATLNLNSLGAVNIVNANGQPLSAGELAGAGGMIEVVYDGANFQITSSTVNDVLTRANTWSQSQAFPAGITGTTVAVSGNISTSAGAITAGATGQGSSQLTNGSATTNGAVLFYNPSGTLTGYAGSGSGGNLFLDAQGGYTGWAVGQNFIVLGATSLNSTLNVTGAASLSSSLGVSGDLAVGGATGIQALTATTGTFASNVGVSGSTTTNSLTANGLVTANANVVVNGNGTNYPLLVQGVAYAASTSGVLFQDNNTTPVVTGYSASPSIAIYTSSYVVGAAFAAISDGRVKTHQMLMTDEEADRFVDHVLGRWYNKTDTRVSEGGFIAQELAAYGFEHLLIALPEPGMVEEANGWSGPVGTRLSVKDGALPLVATSLRAARKRIKKLEERLDDLVRQIDALRS